jgi:hypothetical protein
VIQPDAGAVGTVTFQNPAPPVPPATFVNVPRPPNYVFTGASGGITAVNTGTNLSAADFSTSGSYNVPAAPGRNLLTMNFTSSTNAGGNFGLYFNPSTGTGSQWTDNNFGERAFAGTPGANGLVRLGTISVVPEPMTTTAILLGGLGVVGAVRRYRRGRAATLAA